MRNNAHRNSISSANPSGRASSLSCSRHSGSKFSCRWALGFVMLALMLLVPAGARGETPDALLHRVATSLSGTNSVRCSFSLTAPSGSISGTMRISGSRFAIVTSGGSTWYNGKTMWTYNPRTSETTVTSPTQRELAEVNPLLYVAANYKNFKAEFGSNPPQGCKSLVLTPKGKASDFRRAVLTVASKGLVPKKLVVSTTSGEKIVITLTEYNGRATLTPSEFEYPKAKYPKAKLIDLR